MSDTLLTFYYIVDMFYRNITPDGDRGRKPMERQVCPHTWQEYFLSRALMQCNMAVYSINAKYNFLQAGKCIFFSGRGNRVRLVWPDNFRTAPFASCLIINLPVDHERIVSQKNVVSGSPTADLPPRRPCPAPQGGRDKVRLPRIRRN
jgi:hypothetical protein